MSREQTITQYISTLLEKEGERGRFEKEAEKYKPKSGLMTNRNEPKKDEPVDTAPKVMSSSDHLFNAVEEMSRYVDDSGSDALTDSISRSVRIPNVPTSIDRRTPLVDLYRLNMGGETEQGFLKAPAAPVAPSIDTEGKGKLSFAQSMINSLRSRYQEKRINPNVKSLPEQDSITATELDGAAVGGASDGKVDEGLMSPSDTANLNNPQTREGISFVSTPAVDSIYDEIGAVETETAHLGKADYKNVGITLGYGIVPTSGLKYKHKGTVINLPKNTKERWNTLSDAGVTRENFEPDNVITDDVVKDGIRRDKYDSDESFTKAVMKKFQTRVESAAERQGVDADDIPEDAMVGLVGYSYNTGESHNYTLMRPVYEELTKGANADMTIVQTGMLQVFTEGGTVKQGLANRRRIDYNHVAEALDKPTITHKTNVLLSNGNAGFKFEFSDKTTRTFDSGKNYQTKTSQDDFKDDLNVRQAVS